MATKVVVIGGSGFLGSHLADRLSEKGYQVSILDQAPSPWLRPDQEMIVGSILNPEVLDQAIKGASYVYHLAGLADIGEAASRPRDAIILNVIGSIEVIEACLRHRVQKLLVASTIYVYSDKGSFYRVSKQAVELLLETYGKERGLSHTILRFGSLYGPRAQEWNGLKRFVVQAVRDGRIVYPGTGHERREYIHVADAARMSVTALAPEYDNECLTLTGSQVMSTREMLEMIGEILGRDIELSFATGDQEYRLHHYRATPYRYLPKLGRKIVPSAFIDLGQGILEMIDEIHTAGSAHRKLDSQLD